MASHNSYPPTPDPDDQISYPDDVPDDVWTWGGTLQEPGDPRTHSASDPSSSPASETRSASDIFANLDRDLDLEAGIMSDHQGLLLPSASSCVRSCDQPTLSPGILFGGIEGNLSTASTQTTDPVAPEFTYTNLAPMPLQTATYSTDNTLQTNIQPAPRLVEVPPLACGCRGRGRTKLPEEKLKKNQRRQTRPEKCLYCPKDFEWKKGLRRHLRTHHKRKALADGLLDDKDVEVTRCPYCPQKLARSDYLTRHLDKKHGRLRAGSRG